MIELNKARLCRGLYISSAIAALLMMIAGCTQNQGAVLSRSDVTLTIGYGENPEAGIRQTITNIALEGLVRIDRDGRPSPWLAERWSMSPDGLTYHLQLQPNATFHNGQPVTASFVLDIVRRELPDYLGPVFDDVQEIRASGPRNLEVNLKRRSTFLQEGLDVLIRQDGEAMVGTGPFSIVSEAPREAEMRANASYYGGTPSIDRIIFKSYDSVRPAWADMLRGRVDMLYEVGIDAVDSLTSSTQTKVFTFQRPYAYVVIFNIQRPELQDKALRRSLNEAVDRDVLVAEALNGHGISADGPVWPYHWAHSKELPRFQFRPRRVVTGQKALRLTCLVMTDPTHERLGLLVQQQLRAIGVELSFEQLPSDQLVSRVQQGDFEMALADARMGPSLLRPYQLWYSGAPANFGHFSSTIVDRALDRIRSAADDATYKAGVADFQRAIVDDPPAVFLAWGERLRAVSTRFEVPAEPGRDILIAPVLRLWRPAAGGAMTDPN